MISEKLQVINSMPIEDYSVLSDEVEYVITKETEEKVKALREIGMTDDDYKEMTQEEGYLELSYFAFEVLGAELWSRKKGFQTTK